MRGKSLSIAKLVKEKEKVEQNWWAEEIYKILSNHVSFVTEAF